MRGLHFNYDIGYGDILNLLFQNLRLPNYEWYVTENEIIEAVGSDNLLLPEKSKGSTLFELVNGKHYLVIFLNLQAYPKGADVKPIKTYEDFCESECELLLLISDSTDIDIYSKNDELTLQLADRIRPFASDSLIFLTDSTDERTHLKAF